MAERMRTLMGKSSSKLGIAKGSMNHIGTTPYKYKVSLFISHVDGISTAGEVCVTMERRGKNEATSVVKVKDKKAVFRETISMETTLFRRQSGGVKTTASSPQSGGEELKFDEKIAKIALRKGGAEGKSLGKIHLNLADYIKGPSGTVFADIKLSNDSVIVSKIESELLEMGKKKKNGDDESEALSDTTERDTGMEDDSIFGDNAEEKDDIDILLADMNSAQQPATSPAGAARHTPRVSPRNLNIDRSFPAQTADEKPVPGMSNSDRGSLAPSKEERPAATPQTTAKLDIFPQRSEASMSDASSSSTISAQIGTTAPAAAKHVQIAPGETHRLVVEELSSKVRKARDVDEKTSEGLDSSSSLRNRIKARLKRDKTTKTDSGQCEGSDASTSPTAVAESSFAASATEIGELRLALDSAQNENKKLKASKQALMAEIDSLRFEIEAAEATKADANKNEVESMKQNSNGKQDLLRANKELQDKVYELEMQIDDLRNELEQASEEARRGASALDRDTDSMTRVRTYERKIEDLETALRREPQYLDVVDELKVTKMALALANMEKEQAIFALKQHEAAIAARSNSPSSGWTLF